MWYTASNEADVGNKMILESCPTLIEYIAYKNFNLFNKQHQNNTKFTN